MVHSSEGFEQIEYVKNISGKLQLKLNNVSYP
jgi:hypothetical protein